MNDSEIIVFHVIYRDNGFESKITLLKGKIEEIELPCDQVNSQIELNFFKFVIAILTSDAKMLDLMSDMLSWKFDKSELDFCQVQVLQKSKLY